jgi:hypothetical protein
MAKQRMAAARNLAQLTACTFLVFSALARADEPPPPYAEYSVLDEYFRDPGEAGLRAMLSDCARFGLPNCQLLSVTTYSSGYAYTFQYLHEGPGGSSEWIRREDGGFGVYSCPAGFALYMVAFGMPVGPYENRTIDLGGPFPVVCQASGAISPAALSPRVEDRYGPKGLARRDISTADDAVHWEVEEGPGGVRVRGSGRDWLSVYLISGSHVVAIGDDVSLGYSADGVLTELRGADGTAITEGNAYDPEGRLRARLAEATTRMPEASAPGPLGIVGRLRDSIDALLDGRADPHAPTH